MDSSSSNFRTDRMKDIWELVMQDSRSPATQPATLLAFYWQQDPFGVSTEVDELERVFRDALKFSKVVKTALSHMDRDFLNKVAATIRNVILSADSELELLVLYFEGLFERRQSWVFHLQGEMILNGILQEISLVTNTAREVVILGELFTEVHVDAQLNSNGSFALPLSSALEALLKEGTFTTDDVKHHFQAQDPGEDTILHMKMGTRSTSSIILYRDQTVTEETDQRKIATREAEKDNTEHFFDLRVITKQMISDREVQALAENLKKMMFRGVLSASKIDWQGFKTTDLTIQDADSAQVGAELFDTNPAIVYSDVDPYGKSESADQWLNFVEDRVHKFFRKGPNSWKNPKRRIRVAILDTGYDSSHPLFKLKPVKDCFKKPMSFLDKPNEPGLNDGPDFDKAGHGTHAAWLLHRVAPNADIYVAKVVQESKYPPRFAKNAAKAVRHAVEKWEVDIISMSFGFTYEEEDFEKAIREAQAKDVLMFAAASNHGATSLLLPYPARWGTSHGLFSIHSVDGQGNRSPFTPRPPSPNETAFAALGEHVRSAWPTPLRKGLERRSSGTSISTPIAAGVAALVLSSAERLDNSSHQFSQAQLRKLRSFGGMREVLKVLSHPDGDRYTLMPWFLFNNEDPDDKVFRKIKDALDNA